MIAPTFHPNFGTFSLWGIGSAGATFVVMALLTIDPNSLVTFGTVGMLFATPVAVIINTIMARTDARRAAKKADEVAQEAAKAATRLSDSQKDAAKKAAEVADKLLTTNKEAATHAKNQTEKLDEIHTLVNSNLTAAKQGELSAYRSNLVLMKEMMEMRRVAGTEPSAELLLEMRTLETKIAELNSQLVERLQS